MEGGVNPHGVKGVDPDRSSRLDVDDDDTPGPSGVDSSYELDIAHG